MKSWCGTGKFNLEIKKRRAKTCGDNELNIPLFGQGPTTFCFLLLDFSSFFQTASLKISERLFPGKCWAF